MMKDFIHDPYAPPHHHTHGPIEMAQVANASAYARLFTKLTQHMEDDTRHITDEERKKWNDKADGDAFTELKQKVLQLTQKEIPTRVSQLTNDAGYITQAQLDSAIGNLDYVSWQALNLVDYAKKSDLNGYATQQWVLSELANIQGGSGATYLKDLNDVEISNPVSGQVLKYQGGKWVNATDEQGSGSGTTPASPVLEIYFKNYNKGVTPTGITIGNYLTEGFKKTNTNPGENEDTWAIWVTFLDGTAISMQGPINLTGGGTSGTNGEDGTEIEWIYRTSAVELTNDSLQEWYINLTNDAATDRYKLDDHVPTDWHDNPSGITSTVRYEYASFRTSKNVNGKRTWENTSWCKPVLWSAYGKQGTDGDGVEYIFAISDNGIFSDALNPSKWESNLSIEYIPEDAKGVWKDDPENMTTPGQYVYVSTRKKQNGEWQKYSEPAIWSYYGKDGKDGKDGRDGDAGIGLTIDTDNDVMGVTVDSNNKNTGAFNQTANVFVYQTDNTAESTLTGLTIESIDGSKPNSTVNNTVKGYFTIQDNKLVANIPAAGNVDFSSTGTIFIKLKATINYNGMSQMRYTTVQVTPIVLGRDAIDGASYSLGLDTKIIKRDVNGGLHPSTINSWISVVKGTENISTIPAGSSNLGNFSLTYKADSNSETSVPSTGVATSGVSDKIQFYLKYNNAIIDQEVVYVVGDGRDGQDGKDGTNGHDGTDGINGTNGKNAVGYLIIPLASSLHKEWVDGDDDYFLRGSVSFRFVKIEGTTRTVFTPKSATDIQSTFSGVHANGLVIHKAIDQSTIDSDYMYYGEVENFSDDGGKYFTFTFNDNVYYSDLNCNFVTIQLRGTESDPFSYPLASVVIPINIPGDKGGKGDPGSVQSLNANIIRISTWEDPIPQTGSYYLSGTFGTDQHRVNNPAVYIAKGTKEINFLYDYNNRGYLAKTGVYNMHDDIKTAIRLYFEELGYTLLENYYYYNENVHGQLRDYIKVYNDGSVAEDGIYYTDIVDYGGVYYKCTKYATLNMPCDSEYNENPGWSAFSVHGDSYFNTAIAKYLYAQDITAKNVVVTDDNGKVVAGMTSGNIIPTELDGTTNDDGIRIWAGPFDSSGNVASAPFTVDNSGRVTLRNADVSGAISSNQFETELLDDKILQFQTTSEADMTLKAGKYSGVTGGFKLLDTVYLFVNGMYIGHASAANQEVYGSGIFTELSAEEASAAVNINYIKTDSSSNALPKRLTITFDNRSRTKTLYAKIGGIRLSVPGAKNIYDIFEIGAGNTVTYTYDYDTENENVILNWTSGALAVVQKIGTFEKDINPNHARPNAGVYLES